MGRGRVVSPREAFRADPSIRSSGRWLTCPTSALTPEERSAWSVENRGRRLTAGEHTALLRLSDDCEPEVFMNDAEWHEHKRVLAPAGGRVLVAGLGLGCIVRALFARGRVDHITVVEREIDVINLVWPALGAAFGDRVKLHHADAITGALPAGRWDLVWHDIWPTISAMNIPEMWKLRQRYRQRARRQLCWGEGWAWADLRDGVRSRLLRALRPAVVVPLHAYYSPAHLEHVVAEMERRGPPRIRAYFDEVSGAWFSKEGTHRLRAAHRLGIAPVIVSVRWWRSPAALVRARFAISRAHRFDRVTTEGLAAAPNVTT